MSNNEMLLNNAERLGIRDSSTIKKAEAFYRVLTTKTISKTISNIAQTVICLDLSANNLGTPFDKITALKLAGLKKTNYQNNLNNVEKALDLDKPITIAELCVQLGYSEIKGLAERILTEYKEVDTKIKDIDHPQYVAVAVYTACKIKNIKTERAKFIATSRLKPLKWNDLAEEFIKFANSLGLSKSTAKNKSKKTTNKENEIAETIIVKQKKKYEDEQVEDYEVWKERIINEANALILLKANSES